MKVASSTRTLVAVLVVVALALAFWMLLLGPKREKSDELSVQAEQLQSTLAQNQSVVAAGEEARKVFPTNYQQLVVLGKAVPAGDESSSLLIQLNHVANSAGVKFESLKVGTANGAEAAVEAQPAEEPAPEGEEPEESSSAVAASSVEPTESAAASTPIGATVGPAGLSTLPYDLTFTGSFFDVADFIKGIDSLIHTKNSSLEVDGRLVTLDGFSLSGDAEKGFPALDANFSVTTYLVPLGQGVTAGATPAAPAEGEASSTTVSSLR